MRQRLRLLKFPPETRLQPIISVSVCGPLTILAIVSVAAAVVAPVLPVSVMLEAVTPLCIPHVLPLMPDPAVLGASLIPIWTLILCSMVMPALGWRESAGLCTCILYGDVKAAGCVAF